LGWPVMLVEALLIRWDSPGPALFFQSRVAQSRVMRGSEIEDRSDLRFPPPGLDSEAYYWVPRSFAFFKFRTMYHDALKRFPELYDYSFRKHDFYTSFAKTGGEDDPRVTRIGYYLRRLTIDELPNFWCVLIGQMRLVGPRPELTGVVHAYTPAEMYKFGVKPGITGLAQINGRGLLTRGETLKWDLEYVRTRTVWLDIKILLRTLWLVLTRRGAF
jgi:lipopolysaccharide/colanic/teichoic acid biosynthesis glycosyltransferase